MNYLSDLSIDIYAERYRGMTREQQTCCLTGHRMIPPGEEQKIMIRAKNILVRLIREQNVRYFGVGGAVGFDMLAAEYLLHLKAHEEQQIRIISVLPYPGWREGEEWDDQAAPAGGLDPAAVRQGGVRPAGIRKRRIPPTGPEAGGRLRLLRQLLQPAEHRHRLYGEIRHETRSKGAECQQF